MRPALQEICAQLTEAVSAPQIDKLVEYLALLQRWNATYNLTAVRDPAQMLSQHVADCLAAVVRLPLDRRSALDVGSGGGLPGIVIAVLRPDWAVTCIDSVGKKAAFIRQAAGALALPNLEAAHVRVESHAERHDIVISRAFATLQNFVRLTDTALSNGGCWVAMKGQTPDDEIADLPASIDMFHVEQLRVPTLDARRCLVWMRRKVG